MVTLQGEPARPRGSTSRLRDASIGPTGWRHHRSAPRRPAGRRREARIRLSCSAHRSTSRSHHRIELGHSAALYDAFRASGMYGVCCGRRPGRHCDGAAPPARRRRGRGKCPDAYRLRYTRSTAGYPAHRQHSGRCHHVICALRHAGPYSRSWHYSGTCETRRPGQVDHPVSTHRRNDLC